MTEKTLPGDPVQAPAEPLQVLKCHGADNPAVWFPRSRPYPNWASLIWPRLSDLYAVWRDTRVGDQQCPHTDDGFPGRWEEVAPHLERWSREAEVRGHPPLFTSIRPDRTLTDHARERVRVCLGTYAWSRYEELLQRTRTQLQEAGELVAWYVSGCPDATYQRRVNVGPYQLSADREGVSLDQPLLPSGESWVRTAIIHRAKSGIMYLAQPNGCYLPKELWINGMELAMRGGIRTRGGQVGAGALPNKVRAVLDRRHDD